MPDRQAIVAPFLRRGPDTGGMMLRVLVCLALTALLFGWRWDPRFLWRFPLCLLLAAGIEGLYGWLRDGVLLRPRASTLVTAALLVLSVPAHMPLAQLAAGILAAVWFAKLSVDRAALRLNPMLVGRLFLMVAFPDATLAWLRPGTPIAAFTAATPLGLRAAEGVAWNPWRLLLGDAQGTWEDVVTLVPGAPGDVLPLLTVGFGLGLYLAGVLDWRPGAMFLAGFALAGVVFGRPVAFELASGSVIFSAVYIVTDPRSMPASRAGRLVAGALAGVFNAAVRAHGYFPEGVVVAVLGVNLLSPTLDRIAFALRGARWRVRAARHLRQREPARPV